MTNMRIDQAPAPVLPSQLPSPAPESPEEALGWLGGTADEVAEGLRARGIRGKRLEARDCPLACYLRTWWEEVSIYQNFTVWNHDEDSFHDGPTPDPCYQFARKFDAREYPDLLA